MDEIIVGGGLHEHDDDMLTEEISDSATCCEWLKETSDAATYIKCSPRSHIFCDYANEDGEIDILCTNCFKTENT